jgi:hypothetical protein
MRPLKNKCVVLACAALLFGSLVVKTAVTAIAGG